ncbi:hypothetical protein PAXINDRAFT_97883 [Paxillus involutus ATCC 200175]|nr:hypothetical protein PAXINDRAFT_97883 [Paxillus involutus ATCC 200175]
MAATANWIIVDDRDPGITYSGSTIWHGGTSQEYDGTTTGLDPGDTATYYFNASAIGVFGTYGPVSDLGPPVAVYQVDNTPATTVTAPNIQQTLYRQNFWTSSQLSQLSPGFFHELVITVVSQNDTQLWIDYLAYPDSGPTTTSSASSPTTAPLTTSVAPTTSASSSSTSLVISSTPSGSSQSSSSSKNFSAITGGIAVGAVAFLLIISGLLIYLIRRRRARRAAERDAIQRTIIREEFESPPPRGYSQNSGQNTFGTASTPMQHMGAGSYASVPLRSRTPEELRSIPDATRTLDGGVSLLGGPLDIPPEYQDHY